MRAAQAVKDITDGKQARQSRKDCVGLSSTARRRRRTDSPHQTPRLSGIKYRRRGQHHSLILSESTFLEQALQQIAGERYSKKRIAWVDC